MIMLGGIQATSILQLILDLNGYIMVLRAVWTTHIHIQFVYSIHVAHAASHAGRQTQQTLQ